MRGVEDRQDLAHERQLLGERPVVVVVAARKLGEPDRQAELVVHLLEVRWSRVASQMYECTAITVTLQPDGPYIAVQLPNHSRNHVRPSPAVAGVMSVESGKSRITCDHARATVAASLLQLWRLFGSLKPSMKLDVDVRHRRRVVLERRDAPVHRHEVLRVCVVALEVTGAV